MENAVDNYRLRDDIQNKVLAFAFGLSAEIERNLISQRKRIWQGFACLRISEKHSFFCELPKKDLSLPRKKNRMWK